MDTPLPEDEAIEASHPMKTGRHDLYAEAMRLVGARHSKGGLVNLVCWLLHRVDQQAADLRNAQANVRDIQAQLGPGPLPCPDCGVRDCGGAPRFKDTTSEERLKMRAEEALDGTIEKLQEENRTLYLENIELRGSSEHRACVHGGGPTCIYLKDGTKIVVRRDPDTKGRCWLEHVKQAKITTAEAEPSSEK